MNIKKIMEENYNIVKEKLDLNSMDIKDHLKGIQEEILESYLAYYNDDQKDECNSFDVEVADIILRTLTLCKSFNIDIEQAIKNKIAYNKLRKYE